ncbi:MAG: 4Fe-4S dicluster domain [Clostridia bacterium]|nr:4Fe-4S dicluster domain [Clostridia bacterium]
MLADCLHCGACRRVCPVQRLGRASFPGSWEKDEPNPAVWNCTNCWLCQENCPQGLDLWQAKALAQRQQPPPPGIARSVANLRNTGLSLPVIPEINENRQEYELSPLKPVNPQILSLLAR